MAAEDYAVTTERSLLHFLGSNMPLLDKLVKSARHVAREEAVAYAETDEKERQKVFRNWKARYDALRQAFEILNKIDLVSAEGEQPSDK